MRRRGLMLVAAFLRCSRAWVTPGASSYRARPYPSQWKARPYHAGTTGGGHEGQPSNQEEQRELRWSSSTESTSSDFSPRQRLKHLRHKPGWYRKSGRLLSKNSRRRVRELWPEFGVDKPRYGSTLDLRTLFNAKKEDRIVLEVGFGGGECLQELASRHAHGDVYFFGVEWHRGSLCNAMTRLQSAGLSGSTVRVMLADMTRLLHDRILAHDTVDEVAVLFPDPWPKKVDWPRRVLNRQNLRELGHVVREGGFLHVATDVVDYAVWVGEVGEADGEWDAVNGPHPESVLAAHRERAPGHPTQDMSAGMTGLEGERDTEEMVRKAGPSALTSEQRRLVYGLQEERPPWRPVTAYETRGTLELCHGVYDLCYRRRPKRCGHDGDRASSAMHDSDSGTGYVDMISEHRRDKAPQ